MAQVDSVLEVVEDLKKKIDELKATGSEVEGESLKKIDDIKQKAINVLSQASNKIIDSTNDITNPEEIERSLEIIKVKSKELFDNAMNRINSIIGFDEIKQIKADVEKTEDVVKEEVKVETDEVSEVKEDNKTIDVQIENKLDELSYEAINILKDWLKER